MRKALQRPWLLLGLCTLPALLACYGEAGRLLLRYDRDAILDGELWRLITGHLVHLGWGHLALNLAGLALLWALFFAHYSPLRWLAIMALSIAFIDIGFLSFEPSLQWYVGLSGILHGVMAAGAVAWWRQREPGAWLLGLFLIGKLIWEQSMGAMPFSSQSAGGPVIVDAHLYGALGGAVAALIIHPWFRRQPQPPI